VFLDRDDTLMEAKSLPAPPPPAALGDVVDPALVKLLPGAQDACWRLKDAGFALIVVSNQGVVARGGATMDQVHRVNRKLVELLGDGLIDAFYFCPFHPKGHIPEFAIEHPWHKPRPGMILAAAAEMDLDLSASWLIGDAPRDIAAGVAAGIDAARCLRIEGEVSGIAAAAQTVVNSTR